MGGGGGEVEPFSFRLGRHSRLYQEIYGGDEVAGSEVYERFNKVFFPVRWLVLFEEISRGIRLHWCLFDWYGENQHQSILQGYDRGFNKGLAWWILHSVE